jgi:HEAT repeat protein
MRMLAAIKPLIATLHDRKKEVRSAAAKALNRITGEDFGGDAAKWEAWERERVAAGMGR